MGGSFRHHRGGDQLAHRLEVEPDLSCAFRVVGWGDFLWDGADTDLQHLSSKTLTRELCAAVSASIRAQSWEKVAAKPRSGGLSKGIDWKIPRRLFRLFQGDPKKAGMLRCLLLDSFVTPARRWEGAVSKASPPGSAPYDDGSYGCPHGCGASRSSADHLHVLWTCPMLGTLGLPEVEVTDKLAKAARRHCGRGQDGGIQNTSSTCG